jgi:hypothetical protein
MPTVSESAVKNLNEVTAADNKKPYHSPHLKVYGDMRELTLFDGGPGTDGVYGGGVPGVS